MLDGKGLVYQKRAGTGSAVYSTPDFKVGANPLDVLANQTRVEGKYKVAAEAKKKAENLKALEVDLTGWDYDNKRYFADMENQLKREGAALATAGKDLNNFADKDVADWHQKADKWVKAAKASANQGEMYKSLVDLAAKDPDKYDLEATMSGAKQYMEMTPDQRLQQDPQTLLVRRYDPYGPVEDLKINDFGSTAEWKGLKNFSTVETLATKKLRNEINSRAENPESLKFYEYNKNKYGWKDLNDYKEFLYQYKKNQFVADSKAGLIDPGNTQGWGFGDYLSNATNSGPITLRVKTSSWQGGSTSENQDATIYHGQGIGGVNIVVPNREALDLTVNQKMAGDNVYGNYTLQNGNLGVGLIRTDNGQLIPSYGKKDVPYYLPDENGKKKEYTLKEAIDAGKIKYTPVIQGTGLIVDETGIIKGNKPIMIEADKFVSPDMARSTAGANDAYQKYIVTKQIAEQYNQIARSQKAETEEERFDRLMGK